MSLTNAIKCHRIRIQNKTNLNTCEALFQHRLTKRQDCLPLVFAFDWLVFVLRLLPLQSSADQLVCVQWVQSRSLYWILNVHCWMTLMVLQHFDVKNSFHHRSMNFVIPDHGTLLSNPFRYESSLIRSQPIVDAKCLNCCCLYSVWREDMCNQHTQ